DYQPGSFNMQRVEFMEYFHDVYEQAEFLARKKDIDLIYETGTLSGEMYIKADSLHLRRLFFNLIDNAIKFTPRKGKIKLALVKEKSALKASVSDTGEGIPPEKLPKIFDRFYRANDRVVGSGLGLSIAYSIAKLHNAKLDVQSELGQGTTFSVLIPIV
ncbi:MAG: ATP-binding protein, partial [Candidatus Omnitrophica bacterium]|nr:ATP-binding protein [Candidatus Omnitrophota bacterium]